MKRAAVWILIGLLFAAGNAYEAVGGDALSAVLAVGWGVLIGLFVSDFFDAWAER